MQLARSVPIRRVEDIEQRGVVPVAVDPFFVGERHRQVCFALKTIHHGIGPAITGALKSEGRYHGGNRHYPGITCYPGHDRRNAAACSTAESSE